MKESFAPGPWEKSFEQSFFDGNGGWSICAPAAWQGPGTCQPWPASQIRKKDDADLICAAPDLLHTLESLMRAVAQGEWSKLLVAMSDAQAVVRKARGIAV